VDFNVELLTSIIAAVTPRFWLSPRREVTKNIKIVPESADILVGTYNNPTDVASIDTPILNVCGAPIADAMIGNRNTAATVRTTP
jgi:hypothetical protein